MTQQQNTRTVEGTVWRVSDTGLKLDGIDGWFNFSKQKTIQRPSEGDRVILTLTPWKDTEFIQHVAFAHDDPEPIDAPRGSRAEAMAAPQTRTAATEGVPPHREVMIARESALKAAVEFYKDTGMDADQISRIADEWSIWIITGQLPEDQEPATVAAPEPPPARAPGRNPNLEDLPF